ncbi:MAG TPA: ABC transporter permease [Caulobacteraceae bacterium]|nr:ABC transporter permease [Caulobacteraceae bacterium]
MEAAADFSLERGENGETAVLTGDWTSMTLGDAGARLGQALRDCRRPTLDLTGIGRCDTHGAYTIVRSADGLKSAGELKARPETRRLLDLVAEASQEERAPVRRISSAQVMTERVGKGVVDLGWDFLRTTAFTGRVLTTAGRAIVNPRHIRLPSVVSLFERAGLDAIPIVATTAFFIGAVVGLIGANMLSQFGAQVFAVELIGIAVLREFGILIAAILLAGRSASSFAAEIGSMKMNEEVDAMQVMGVDPFDGLVLPRFIALLLAIPLLTFVSDMAGMIGGLLVTWTVLDLTPAFFLQRIVDNVGAGHFWVGMSKAPVMALVIAGIGCRQGMEVAGDVESLGRRVTAAVVHAIFAIILIDAIFALIFMELDV